MIAALGRWIGARSSPRMTLILLGALCLFIPLFVLYKEHAPVMGLPGGQLGYSPDETYRALEEVGGEGRRWFTLFQVVDLPFIATYALLYGVTIRWSYRSLFGDSRWAGLWLVPLLAAAADYAENICLLVLLGAYPERLRALTGVASAFTSAKWVLASGSLLLAVGGLLGVAAVGGGRALRRLSAG